MRHFLLKTSKYYWVRTPPPYPHLTPGFAPDTNSWKRDTLIVGTRYVNRGHDIKKQPCHLYATVSLPFMSDLKIRGRSVYGKIWVEMSQGFNDRGRNEKVRGRNDKGSKCPKHSNTTAAFFLLAHWI